MNTFVQMTESSDNRVLIRYYQEKNLLVGSRKCAKCQKEMHIRERDDVVDGYGWRCECGKRCSLRRDSFFEPMRSSLQIILKMILYWALQNTQTDQSILLNINTTTIINFQKKIVWHVRA